MIQIKRVYEEQLKTDGYRVLIDRLWPRGLTKKKLNLDSWFKELSPSNELRKQFGHDPKKWKAFQVMYRKELHNSLAQEKLEFLANLAKKEKVTLLYGAKDEEHNDAVVLKGLIENKMKH